MCLLILSRHYLLLIFFYHAIHLWAETWANYNVGSKVSASSSSTEESITVWYKNKIYTVPCLRRFRDRTLKHAGGGGSLYGNALSRADGIELHNEILSSVAQLDTSKFVVPTEKSLIFLSAPMRSISADLEGGTSFKIAMRGARPVPVKKFGYTA